MSFSSNQLQERSGRRLAGTLTAHRLAKMPPTASQPFKNSPSLDSLTLLSISSPGKDGVPAHMARRRSRPQSPRPLHLARSGEPLTTTGHASVGSEVPIDLLQSVILAPTVQEGEEEVRESSKGWLRQRAQSYKREKPTASTDTVINVPVFLGDETEPSSSSTHPVLLSPAALPKTPLQQHTFDQPPPIVEPRSRTTTTEVPASWTRTIAYTPALSYPPVRYLSGADRKRVLVTGGAGFVGSHLVDRLMFMGCVKALSSNSHSVLTRGFAAGTMSLYSTTSSQVTRPLSRTGCPFHVSPRPCA